MLKSVILAAGKGTRMKSDKPKVVHQVLGKPMVYYSIEAAEESGADEVCIIVGYKADEVKQAVEESYSDRQRDKNIKISYAFQTEQLGTGHAVLCASDFIGTEGDVIILCGDTPLVKGMTLKNALDIHRIHNNGVTVISAMLDNPFGYGRIIRNDGEFLRIVEEKDASSEEKKVCEVNSGMYIFKCAILKEALTKISNNNNQKEYYLTDTVEIIKKMGYRIDAAVMQNAEEIIGVNSMDQLENVSEIMKNR